MKRVVLHIDRLVLKGFPQAHRHEIASGIQQELMRLYNEPHSASQLMQQGNTARLHIGNVSISHGANPQRAGKQIARGISKGIKA